MTGFASIFLVMGLIYKLGPGSELHVRGTLRFGALRHGDVIATDCYAGLDPRNLEPDLANRLGTNFEPIWKNTRGKTSNSGNFDSTVEST